MKREQIKEGVMEIKIIFGKRYALLEEREKGERTCIMLG